MMLTRPTQRSRSRGRGTPEDFRRRRRDEAHEDKTRSHANSETGRGRSPLNERRRRKGLPKTQPGRTPTSETGRGRNPLKTQPGIASPQRRRRRGRWSSHLSRIDAPPGGAGGRCPYIALGEVQRNEADYIKRMIRASHPSEACPGRARQSPEYRRTTKQTMLYKPMSRLASQMEALHASPRSDKPDHESSVTRR